MITRIGASQYRCLKKVSQSLGHFQILVGPNGSGKSVFMDTLAFVRTLLSANLEEAVRERSRNFDDLIWDRQGHQFDLAIEAQIPDIQNKQFDGVRYFLRVRAGTDTLGVEREELMMLGTGDSSFGPVLMDRSEQRVQFWDEKGQELNSHALNRKLSALTHVIPDRSKFSATLGLAELLREGVYTIALTSSALQLPSPPLLQSEARTLDGSHLPWWVARLQEKSPELFREWVAHLRTCIPDLTSVRSVQRPEDQHRYLMIEYESNVTLPSWVVSDGTLRLLALTIIAYMPNHGLIYSIEEPENGVHPTAIEAIYQSLSSVYDGQVLVASHSPILLNLAKPEELLCFSKTAEGTQIVSGKDHPALRDWKGEVNLSDLFAAGVLG